MHECLKFLFKHKIKFCNLKAADYHEKCVFHIKIIFGVLSKVTTSAKLG